ncbi:transporter [Alsobacter metallidurans]|uniref:Transporter n=1 Tax=Alsobacter metallidurans TaxID=340221 RepID=A0A917MIR2_9HYPH|nr:hypothetical protein [Alsobacter metallidurans]GGH26195.1 transporter [Alsobacter metallidurans]
MTPAFASLSRALATMGRYGTLGFAISIFVGLALPGLASTMRPVLPFSIFVFVVLTFARADLAGVRRALKQPGRVALSWLWVTAAMPVMVLIALAVVGRAAVDPGLLLGLALVAASPPLMGFAAYTSLLGMDNSVPVALLVLTMAVTPLVSPPLATLVAGAVVPLDPAVLSLRLLWMLGGAFLGAFALRRLVGPARIAALKHEFDGVFVVLYLVFAIAAMDGVIAAALASPAKVALYLVVATLTCVTGLAVTMLVLWRLGRPDSFVLGLGSGMRNTGLLIVAMGAACPPDTYLFFSLLQFPIYCAPLAVAPLAKWVRNASAPAPAS